jgi:hypothetical protein
MNIFSARRLAMLAFTFAWMTLTGASAFAAPAVVGHKALAAEKLDAATLKSVFLGKKVAWDGAGRITLAVLKGGALAEDFCKHRLEMNVSAFTNHWRRLAMTGGGIAPKFFETEAELLKFVAATPGAVGFVDQANANDTVAALALP